MKAQRRRALAQVRRKMPPDRVILSADRELRRKDGIWYEVTVARLPQPEYRTVTEVRRVALRRHHGKDRTIEMELNVRRLITPWVLDVMSGKSIPAGPEIDEESAWREYRRNYPDRHYAVSKRQLSKKVLRRDALANC